MRNKMLVAAVALLSGCLVPKDQYDALKGEMETRGRQHDADTASLAAMQKRLEEIDAQLAQEKKQREEVEQKLAQAETRLTDQEAQRRDLSEKNAQLAAMNEELSRSAKTLQEAKAELEKRSSEYENLAHSLKGEIDAGKVELSELKGRMTVKMKDKILFGSGSAKIGKEGASALDKVADALKDVKGKIIRVEGHTDDDPVDPKGPYPSNWELSLARAMAVVQHLQDRGVDPRKLSAAGFGQYQPIAANDTPEHKSRNRRIEIVLAADPSAGASAPMISPAKAEAPAKAATPAKASAPAKKRGK